MAKSSGPSCLGQLFVTLLMALTFLLGAGAVLTSSAQGEWAAQGSGVCEVSSKYPQKVLKWCGLITEQSKLSGLDPDLTAALIWLESGGNPKAYSHSGAVGLMQVMPRDGLAANFRCPKGPCFADRPTILELEEPAYNVAYGTKMLSSLIETHGGDLRRALRDYGPMDVGYSYADRVLGIFEDYRE